MSVTWDHYSLHVPATEGPYHTLPRKLARRQYQLCMEQKPWRIATLTELLRSNGVTVGGDEQSVDALNEWFVKHVEEDPANPRHLVPKWYSVVHDIALLLGDLIIEYCPNLRWEFYTWGRTASAYQRHVIMGFSAEDPKFHTNINIEAAVATVAVRAVLGGRDDASQFWSWIEGARRRA